MRDGQEEVKQESETWQVLWFNSEIDPVHSHVAVAVTNDP
jgi:hypothetical protein